MIKKPRKEKDVIGTVNVPNDAYYGSFTVRANNNFSISGISAPEEFKVALGYVKKAAAQTNASLGEIDKKHAQAIIKATDEFIKGKFDDEFKIDVFQAGAGTPFNMNVNEIISNRANELLGGKKGIYSPITPNNHANWGQSSNDVIPTAIRIAALLKLEKLLPEVEKLANSFFKKGKEFKNILKVGRTHLQDAVPIRLGQEFDSYGSSINRSYKAIKESFAHLEEVAIGGTALGTGITSNPKYRSLMVNNLRKISGFKLKPTKYPMELSCNMNAFTMASNGLRVLANDFIRISKDLRILASGPTAAIYEINLPEVEPGSSIMPGKINPSIVECISMIGFQVLGNDQTINLCVQNSELELNVMTPVMMHNLLWSQQLLTNGAKLMRTKCIDGITPNAERCQALLDNSLCMATGLSSYLGYKALSQLVKESLKKNKTLKETIKSKKFISSKELDQILSPEKLTSPASTNKKLKNKIQENLNYKNYIKSIS